MPNDARQISLHPNEPFISLEILACVYPSEKPSFCYLPKIHKSMGEFTSFGVSTSSRLVRGSSEQIYLETPRVPFPRRQWAVRGLRWWWGSRNIVALAPGLVKGIWIRGLKVETECKMTPER